MSQLGNLPASSDNGAAEAFRAAVEHKDYAALLATLSPEVEFNSPIVYQPYFGRDAVAPLLAAIMEVFADLEYTDEYTTTHGAVLRFQTTVGDRELEGVDILHFDADGLVSEFTVLVRPYSAATALREAMAAKLMPPPN